MYRAEQLTVESLERLISELPPAPKPAAFLFSDAGLCQLRSLITKQEGYVWQSSPTPYTMCGVPYRAYNWLPISAVIVECEAWKDIYEFLEGLDSEDITPQKARVYCKCMEWIRKDNAALGA